MWNSQFSFVSYLSTVTLILADAIQLPKFVDLKTYYPGYNKYGGQYTDKDLQRLIGGKAFKLLPNNTSSLRMSCVLNKIGGKHTIGRAAIQNLHYQNLTLTGKDGHKYIHQTFAFGPYLANKYGNPILYKRSRKQKLFNISKLLHGQQGIVRLLTYKERKFQAGGHITLWDCDHFHQIKDYTGSHHLISVEFWKSPDSRCPGDNEVMTEGTRYIVLDGHV